MPDFALPVIRHITTASNLQSYLAAKRARYVASREKNERVEDLWGGGGDTFARFRDGYRVHEEAAFMSWRNYLFLVAQSSTGGGGKVNMTFDKVLKMARAETEKDVYLKRQSVIDRKINFRDDFFDNKMNVYRIKHVYNYLIKKKYMLLERAVVRCSPPNLSPNNSSASWISDVPQHHRSKYDRIATVLAQVDSYLAQLDSEDGILYTTSRLSYSQLKSVQEGVREFFSFVDRIAANKNLCQYSDNNKSDYSNLRIFCQNIKEIKKQFGNDDRNNITIEGPRAYSSYVVDGAQQPFHFRHRIASPAELMATTRRRLQLREQMYTTVLSSHITREATAYIELMHRTNVGDSEEDEDDRLVAEYLLQLHAAEAEEQSRRRRALDLAANVFLLGAVTIVTSLLVR